MADSGPYLVGIQVGRVRTLDALGDDGRAAPFRSAIVKEAVKGDVAVGPLGLTGDEHASPQFHGGPDKAVLVYCHEHYETWSRDWIPGAGPGGFGENLTISGLDETRVAIGDRLRIGTVELEVTEPRGPCSKLGRRWNRPDLVAEVLRTARPGWYCRVINPGILRAGQVVEHRSGPHAAHTVERIFRITHPAAGAPRHPAPRDLLDWPGLSASLRRSLMKKPGA